MRNTILITGLLVLSLNSCKENKATISEIPDTTSYEVPTASESIEPVQTPISSSVSIVDSPCIFPVVYYSYYSSSEGKTHHELQSGEVFPDTLSREQQKQVLEILSSDCGPVGANVIVTEKKIIYARNPKEAAVMRLQLLADLVNTQPVNN